VVIVLERAWKLSWLPEIPTQTTLIMRKNALANGSSQPGAEGIMTPNERVRLWLVHGRQNQVSAFGKSPSSFQ